MAAATAAVGAQHMAISRQFTGLSPKDLPEAMKVVCTADTKAPAQLDSLWVNLCSEELSSSFEAELESAAFMLVVCDVFDAQQLHVLEQLLVWLDANEAGPPMSLLPLTTRNPDKAGPTFAEVLKADQGLLGCCLDDVILGSPTGFSLAFAVHASYSRAEIKIDKWMDIFRARSRKASERRALRAGIEATLWQYVPQRLHIALPPVDYHLGSQDGRAIAGYAIGQRLALGADDQVYEVAPPAGTPNLVGEMIKVVPKSTVQTSIEAVRRIQRTWQILQMLSGQWRHPNIVRSYQLYHSPTHIYIRMEHCGTESLYHRLRTRDSGAKTLTGQQVQALTLQLADVLSHLHTGPRICHRDIKPENFALTEGGAGELRLKLVNFDTAAVQRPGARCKLKSGTFPFVAPEVAGHKYDGFAADLWSLGILLLELACGVRIIERCVLCGEASGGRPVEVQEKGFPTRAVQCVKAAFAEDNYAQKILFKGGVPEVAGILPWYAVVVGNLLHVAPERRWTAEQLLQVLSALPAGDDESAVATVAVQDVPLVLGGL